MAIPRSTFIDILKDSYSAYYSIHDDPEEIDTELPLVFRADYASRDERYWLTKSVKFWGNEKNEYAYVFAADSFSPEMAERCEQLGVQIEYRQHVEKIARAEVACRKLVVPLTQFVAQFFRGFRSILFWEGSDTVPGVLVYFSAGKKSAS